MPSPPPGEAVPYLDLAAQMRPLRAEVDAAIAATLDHCTFVLGPDVAEFEREFATFCTARHCVAFNSGTSALHVALRLLDIGPEDEVITTPYTFIATSWAIRYVGARPVYVDIDDRTFNLDPLKVGRAMTTKTKAVLPVHLYGHPCALGPLLELCQRAGVPLVEDAAQAHGALYGGKPVGTFGRMAAFSFYPGKNLGAYGEAGALTMDDDALAARARSLRDHGSTRRYYHDELGYNYRMEGLQGAILRVKLKRLAAWTAARRRVARRYQELLTDTPLRLPQEAEGGQSVWHLYVVRHPERDALKAHLDAARIGCALHYPLPLHLQKCFADLGYREGDFPVAERAAKECLALPIYPELTDAQIERVVAAIKAFFQR